MKPVRRVEELLGACAQGRDAEPEHRWRQEVHHQREERRLQSLARVGADKDGADRRQQRGKVLAHAE
eukprot:CAMPEP_0170585270 /NCGR_PEP_ID=MMETSP0224-20130122/9122_1 /TAXON_ID=285029 /ORGANISM="Togula jolla, Strain CCCM 725" /LENGTH=66 /DNA_ID=CAMNT_0010908739 /DNA_START=115 /DNA_END=312 /DNA_ORIENTATION=+